jgi:hypothetical protein
MCYLWCIWCSCWYLSVVGLHWIADVIVIKLFHSSQMLRKIKLVRLFQENIFTKVQYIRLSLNCLQMTNTLDYFVKAHNDKEYCFIWLTPVVDDLIKISFSLILWANKLEYLFMVKFFSLVQYFQVRMKQRVIIHIFRLWPYQQIFYYMDKHSSLFGRAASETFYNIDNKCETYKTLFLVVDGSEK